MSTDRLSNPEWQDIKGPDSWNIPQGEFTVYGTAFIHPEHADKVNAIYEQLTTNAQSELGTIYYCISRDPSDPSQFHFFERYVDRAAFDTHNSQEVVKELLASGWTKEVRAVFAKPVEGK